MVMHINFGSIIPIRAVYVTDKNGHFDYNSPVKNHPVGIFQALTKRINSKKTDYYDKIAKLDIDLRKNPYAATVFNDEGERFLITGEAAQEYRRVTSEYYRTNGSYPEYDKKIQSIFLKEKFLCDRLNNRAFIDMFVTKNRNNKYSLKYIEIVDDFGKKCSSYPEENGQLLLPL